MSVSISQDIQTETESAVLYIFKPLVLLTVTMLAVELAPWKNVRICVAQMITVAVQASLRMRFLFDLLVFVTALVVTCSQGESQLYKKNVSMVSDGSCFVF